jgi:hypothetical protein
VLLGQARFARRIEHGNQFAGMVENGRGRAGQADIARQIMLFLMD